MFGKSRTSLNDSVRFKHDQRLIENIEVFVFYFDPVKNSCVIFPLSSLFFIVRRLTTVSSYMYMYPHFIMQSGRKIPGSRALAMMIARINMHSMHARRFSNFGRCNREFSAG